MTLCVNALNGLLLISSEIDELLVNSKSSCQCPQRASTYFFHFHEILWIPFLGVSMPSTGFYLFLQDPFYPKDDIRWCVNALNGLLLISSAYWTKKTISREMCQCPQRASTYFFNLVVPRQQKLTNWCQCPQRASTYFF